MSAAACKKFRRRARQTKRSMRFWATRQRATKNEPVKKGGKK